MDRQECFAELVQLCQAKNDAFYRGIDQRITSVQLDQAAHIASDAPTATVHQDDDGVSQRIKVYNDFTKRMAISFNYEGAVACIYALLGHALEDVYKEHIERLSRTAMTPPSQEANAAFLSTSSLSQGSHHLGTALRTRGHTM